MSLAVSAFPAAFAAVFPAAVFPAAVFPAAFAAVRAIARTCPVLPQPSAASARGERE
jgi:hypothetical protein